MGSTFDRYPNRYTKQPGFLIIVYVTPGPEKFPSSQVSNQTGKLRILDDTLYVQGSYVDEVSRDLENQPVRVGSVLVWTWVLVLLFTNIDKHMLFFCFTFW